MPSHLRMTAGAQLKDGTNYDYTQWAGGIGIGYQWKRVHGLGHLININSDNESRMVVEGAYEYLWTRQEGASPTYENRAVMAVTPRWRPYRRWLLQDRNRFEFRWVDGVYSTRYRNRIQLERDFLVGAFRFTPYASAEFFYDFAKGSWDEQHYSAGVQWPYRRILMLETYYLYQHSSSAPENINALGLSLNIYFRNGL